jgi:hypothetical protein
MLQTNTQAVRTDVVQAFVPREKVPFFGNENALLSWNRSAFVSGTIELILKCFYMEISFVFRERKYFSRFFDDLFGLYCARARLSRYIWHSTS